MHMLHVQVVFIGRTLLKLVSLFNKAWLSLAGGSTWASPPLLWPSHTSQIPLPTWSCPYPGSGSWGSREAFFSWWGCHIRESNSGVPSASWKYNFYRNQVMICGYLSFMITINTVAELCSGSNVGTFVGFGFGLVPVGWFGIRTAFLHNCFYGVNVFSIPNRHTNELFKLPVHNGL